MDRIAYIGADGNVFTIDPNGADSRRLTGNISAQGATPLLAQPLPQVTIFYTWPTWSPNGQTLAVSQVVAETNATKVSLFTLDANTGSLDNIYDNDLQVLPLITDSVPHYMYWSPNSQNLAFVAATSQGLSLLLHSPGRETQTISRQAPLYVKWSHDGDSMLIHSNDRLLRAASPFTQEPQDLTFMSPFYRVPDLSAQSGLAAYISGSNGDFGILVRDPQSPDSFSPLVGVQNNAALLWSPQGDYIAVADNTSGRQSYDRLRLISADGSSTRVLLDEPFVAFFWSPTGDKIAYVALDSQGQRLVWKVVPVEGGEPWDLVAFIPSPELLAMLSFFDQYAHSHSLWSPDGTRLVFAGTLASPSPQGNGASPQGERIYVINTEPGSLPREIASGSLAFWSWN